MHELHIPDLTFPMISYGRLQTPIDLRVLLYIGGAKACHRSVFNEIAQGHFGSPLVERIALVQKIHGVLTAKLVAGGSLNSIITSVRFVRDFFAWADSSNYVLSMKTVESSYRHWCDFLLHLKKQKKIKHVTVYDKTASVSSILDIVLDRQSPLIRSTPVHPPARGKRAVGMTADKQNLTDTFSFGHVCIDIIDSLPYEAIFGALPATILLRDGRVFEDWSGLPVPAKCRTLQPEFSGPIERRNAVLRTRAKWEANHTLRTRHPLINLRILCEMSVFIAQTGMNLSQANSLRRTQFSYKSTIDGYEVRTYKNRRKGEVLFEIFSEYKKHFERYISWRDKTFANAHSDLLFPFIRFHESHESKFPKSQRLRAFCAKVGVPYISSRMLRKTRLNWLLRQSRNPELTAEQAQHTKQTLLRHYEMPSLQVAMVEITKFWKKNDPTFIGNPLPCPAPGVCDGMPEPIPDLPPDVPKPDCTHQVGCFFCEHHRDIDSADYVWSTASMRHLNTIILQRFRPMAKGKTDAASHVELSINISTAKLKWFRESNARRKAWVEEAIEKVAEGNFHIHWSYLIESAKGV